MVSHMVSFNYELPTIPTDASIFDSVSPEQQYLLQQLNGLLTQKQNLHGRRIGKAKDAINPGDYVTKRQINGNLFGTLALRPQPANVAPGTTYFATDRNVTYQMRNGHWYYKDGIQSVTLSPDTKPSPSVLYDTGYMIYATDFDWYYRWNLITWERLGGANLYTEAFNVAPTKPGWGLHNGTTYTYSKDDGSTGSVATGDLTTGRFLVFSSAGGLQAAVAPTISGSTGNESIGHIHGFTPTGSVSGNIPAHAHVLLDSLVDGGQAHMSNAVNLDSSAWDVQGTVDGTNDSGDLSLSGLVGTSISGSTSPSFDCSDGTSGVESEFPVPFYNCGAVFDIFASLDDGTVFFGSAAHSHGWTGTFTSTSEDHFHLLTGKTETTIVGSPIALTLTFTGTGNVTGVESANHTHTGSSLTISNDGTPAAVKRLPYIRL